LGWQQQEMGEDGNVSISFDGMVFHQFLPMSSQLPPNRVQK
jgi:hypothetical protein